MYINILFLDFSSNEEALKNHSYWKDKLFSNLGNFNSQESTRSASYTNSANETFIFNDAESNYYENSSFYIKSVKNLTHFFDPEFLKNDFLEFISSAFIINTVDTNTDSTKIKFIVNYLDIICRKSYTLNGLQKISNERKPVDYLADFSIMNYGKYKGKTVSQILDLDPRYLNWCFMNIDGFLVTHDVFNKLPSIKVYEEMMYGDDLAVVEAFMMGMDAEKFYNYKHPGKELPQDHNLYKYSHDYHNFINDIKRWKMAKHEEMEREIDEYEYDKYSSRYGDNWLRDASGTDEPDIMNDVYWNLD